MCFDSFWSYGVVIVIPCVVRSLQNNGFKVVQRRISSHDIYNRGVCRGYHGPVVVIVVKAVVVVVVLIVVVVLVGVIIVV